MKTTTTFILTCFLSLPGLLAQETGEPEASSPTVRRTANGLLILDTKGLPPEPRLFFSAESTATVRLSHEAITQDVFLGVKVLQGKPEVITLALFGEGEVVSVVGEQVQFWAVRQGTGEEASNRFLELRPKLTDGDTHGGLQAFEAKITASQPLTELPVGTGVLTLGPGEAVGYVGRVDLVPDETVAVEVRESPGWMAVAVEGETEQMRFQTTSVNQLTLSLEARGAAALPVDLANLSLAGTVDQASKSVRFTLSGLAKVQSEKGGKLRILSGHAALRELPDQVPYQVRLVTQGEGAPYYELGFSGPGETPVELVFDAGLKSQGEWRSFEFSVPASAIVPLRLTGLPEEVRFDGRRAVFPTRLGEEWLGFLPPSGNASTAWRPGGEDEAEGKLFFSTKEETEISVSAGLLRQIMTLHVNVLQGKLNEISIDLAGDGEVLAVEGPNVLGWTVTPGAEDGRRLTIPVSRALEGQSRLAIRSQTPVEEFPVTVKPVRIAPVGSVRHSGSLLVGNQGAVRLQLGEIQGMTQLSASQFRGEARLTKDATQLYVYRIPAAGYDYEIRADQILPEVNVSQIALYHMGESERRIEAAIELDIREAPLREWELAIPEDYVVVSVQGADVADYVVGSEAENGMRSLKILFGEMISGRHVVNLQMEKNEAPAAGDWVLPRLLYPEAKTVRGHLGVTATSGYRIASGDTDKLSELPLTRFPVQKGDLQQAFRLREPDWSATMVVEALGQSVQADVFHLYSLKEGMVYGSVVLNYYVVGAPVSTWRLQVAEGLGNVAIDGEDVQTWQREGDEINVTLHEPALGPSTLHLTFELPMSAEGGALRLGNVAPLDVQGERGLIQVVSPYQVQYEITQASTNLLPLEASELPAGFRLLTSAPSLVAYQYGTRPVDLSMNIQWFEPGETVDQVIDCARLSSHVTSDGQIATEARFHVKTRGRQALRLRLPDDAKLWDAQVEGRAVNARADGEFTVIPLPASPDPNQLVLVVVRLDQRSESATKLTLTAPATDAPMMIGEWKVDSDQGRLLLPLGEAAGQLVNPVVTEDGFEWLEQRGRWVGGLIVLGCAMVAGFLGRGSASRWRPLLAGLFVLVAIFVCGLLVKERLEEPTANEQTAELIARVVTPNEPLTVTLSHVPIWKAMIHPLGLAAILLGVLAAGSTAKYKRVLYKKVALAVGLILVGVGLLLQRFGTPVFFGLLGLWLLLVWFVGCGRVWRSNCRAKREEKAERKRAEKAEAETPESSEPSTPVMPLWLALGIGTGILLGAPEPSFAADLPANNLTQTWRIEGQRLFGELEIVVSGSAGDRFELLKNPAVLTAFTPGGEDVRVSRRVVEGGVNYDMVLESDGRAQATATFEVALPEPLTGFDFPTGTAAVHQLTVSLDQPGWEISSPAAVRTAPVVVGQAQSGVQLSLGVAGRQHLALTPRKRDLSAESSQFYVEVDQVLVARPGVIDARHRISVRPSQGRLRELNFVVPSGFTVSDVLMEAMRTWRFDPETRSLRVEMEAAQANPFRVEILTQRGVTELPADIALEPLRVSDAAGEIGMLALAFGPDAQPESMVERGMSPVNLKDFDQSLLGPDEEADNPTVLHRVYRYGADPGGVDVRIMAVEPDVRMRSRQTLSLEEERLVLAVDLAVSITRSGLFQLRFPVPDDLDVEAISGKHLDHWSEVTEEARRLVVLHLNGRTMGEITFAVTLAGAAPAPQAAWTVPRFTLENTSRATGQLVITPALGIRLQAVSRRNISQLDTRRLAQRQRGTLAFQLLQDDWELQLRVEQLEPWVTAKILQEVILREGQTRTRMVVHYQVENAAVKALRLSLPGLSDTDEDSVQATGQSISDLVRVLGQEDLWEIRFQRGILGKAIVNIDFQQPADRAVNLESISPVTLAGVRQTTHWVAVRSSGRLDLTLEDPDRRWQAVDWSTVRKVLGNVPDSAVPRLCVRAIAPDQPLQVRVQRHAVAEALKLRVAEGSLETILAPSGEHVTKVTLIVEVAEKGPLRVTLPDGAVLFNALVNDQSVALVREGTAAANAGAVGNTYLFYVFPGEGSHRARVTFAYALYGPGQAEVQLTGPSLSLPLQNITWRVGLPQGYTLKSQSGDLGLRSQGRWVFDADHYLAQYDQRRHEQRRQQEDHAKAMLARGNELLNAGKQYQALEAFQNAANSSALDLHSDEDARVQLRQLQTEQAVLGLNSRRQLLVLENRIETPTFARNEQLEEAATLNPFLKGKMNYLPQEVDVLLSGNTAEENSTLARMAGRLVSQQSAAEPALRGIDVTLFQPTELKDDVQASPASGELLTFQRSVQVDRTEPLRIHLKVARIKRFQGWFLPGVLAALVLLAGVGVIGWKTK